MTELLHGLKGLHIREQEGLLDTLMMAAKLPEAGLASGVQLAAERAVESNPEGATARKDGELTGCSLEVEARALQAIATSSLEHGSQAIQDQGIVVLLTGLGRGLLLNTSLVFSGQEQQPGFLLGAQATLCSLLQQAVDELVALHAVVAQEVGGLGLRGEGGFKLDGLAVLASDGEHGHEAKGKAVSGLAPEYMPSIALSSREAEDLFGVLF